MKNGRILRIVCTVAIAVLVAAVMTVLSGIPPFSIVYEWLESNNMKVIWYGLTAGIVALCLLLYRARR